MASHQFFLITTYIFLKYTYYLFMMGGNITTFQDNIYYITLMGEIFAVSRLFPSKLIFQRWRLASLPNFQSKSISRRWRLTSLHLLESLFYQNLVKSLHDKYYLESSNESPQVPEFGDLESPSALESKSSLQS